MSRGRGRGRVRFGGSRDSMLTDLLDETREDIGLSYTQMEQLHNEASGSLYPPIELPQPEALVDRDAYLIQRQRILAHKLANLYHPWEGGRTGSKSGHDASDLAAFVHVTVPETRKDDEVYVPEELRTNSLSGVRTMTAAVSNRGIMQPRAFDTVFKSLEAQEKKIAADKAKKAEQDADDGNIDEVEEDLGDDMNDYTFDYYDSDAVSDEGDEEVFF
ncbi:uncharacterized protein PHALS_10551 [Plasmopara halstedii]|uniref:DNA-directed RNA polymerase III subunit n=1 Tax=Plasmopara halstedii TaxID=4781 RepID=A0A0N7L532_PLAHL|nr:uncharacterized protein PHALS_10551 [Plasmopara halstedii]CEG40347.1 hypothetical protein PHALS_10551 [Plasmopara halstedii]|eukprot:XP_024576716.1 hypothetical protein PHALS_10551 [Plasmopara halstedii]